jgi:hypothetical protein
VYTLYLGYFFRINCKNARMFDTDRTEADEGSCTAGNFFLNSLQNTLWTSWKSTINTESSFTYAYEEAAARIRCRRHHRLCIYRISGRIFQLGGNLEGAISGLNFSIHYRLEGTYLHLQSVPDAERHRNPPGSLNNMQNSGVL